jgi:hypothetical protein
MNKILLKIDFKIKLFVIIYISIFIVACSEIFETDISNSEVNLISPADSIYTTSNTLTFWWDEIEGATNYRLQIVTPSFDSIQELVIDTMMVKTQVSFVFIPGRYEWRVFALNNSSSTKYSKRSFSVDSTSSLSDDKVFLLFPANQACFSKTKIIFQWAKNERATKYVFEIRENNENGDIIQVPQILTTDTISLTLKEGKFYWSLQALNQSSGSQISGRTLIIDQTAPLTPVLQSPNNEDTITGSDVVLKWTRPSGSLAPISDSVFIANDSLFTQSSIIEKAFIDTTNYNINTNDPGWLYWRIKSIDAAGNQSDYSKYRKFIFEVSK